MDKSGALGFIRSKVVLDVPHFLPRFHFPDAPPVYVGLSRLTTVKTAHSLPSGHITSRYSGGLLVITSEADVLRLMPWSSPM